MTDALPFALLFLPFAPAFIETQTGGPDTRRGRPPEQ
jgi:hypothetical protein